MPSMLIAMPFLISRPVKSGARERALVDVEDLGLACLASASSNVSTQTEIIAHGRNLFRTGIKVNSLGDKLPQTR
jgi:hypothetical protein